MDFKKLFRKDDKAVSPVIGVILMVAITVILAAAIGSSVFGHGTSKSAPQASLDIKKDSTTVLLLVSTAIRIEHLGGSDLDLGKAATKVIVTDSVGLQDAQLLNTELAILLRLVKSRHSLFRDATMVLLLIGYAAGTRANIKFVDVASGQIYIDKDITF